MKKVFLPIILCMALSISNVYAQDISISADVDRDRIGLDEQLTLTIIVNGNVSNMPQPQIPPLDGFTSYSSGRSQNISIINSRVTSSVSFSYVLVPNDVGDYTLGPFTIDYKGKEYSAGEIKVKVRQSSRSSAQGPSSAQPGSSQVPAAFTPRDSGTEQKELFIETYVDKLTAYVNEQVTLTFAFYQSVDLFENPRYKPPSTIGFWSEDMPPQKKFYKVINGKKYLVTEIKTALFATSPGEFTIGEARLEASVEDLERVFSRRHFDIFGSDPFSIFKRGKPVILTSEPITLEIAPLPDEGKPSSFRGDVGKFDVTLSVDKYEVEENQPLTLKIQIKGKGNIKTISSPEVPELSDMKFYDSGSSENIAKSDYMVQGEKIFEKVIIPKREGQFSIGPVEYSYFDPEINNFVIKSIPPLTINATKSEEEDEEVLNSSLMIPGLTKEEVKILKKDILHIKTSPVHLKPRQTFLYKNKPFLAVNILPILLLAFLYIYQAHREKLKTDVGYARSRRAKAIASKRLKNAKANLVKLDAKLFYAEIYKVVVEYIADKLNIPHASITKDILERALLEKNAPRELIEKVKSLADTCDMARFASVKFTKFDMGKTFEEAAEIIVEFERIA